MSISADTVTLQPVAAPIAPQPLRQPPVAPVGERDGASNDRRKDAKDGRARGGVSFRSFLNAATFAGLSQAVTRDSKKPDDKADAVASAARAAKASYEKTAARDEPPVIDAEESEQLYRTAQTAKQTAQKPAQQTPNVHAREYQAASTRYAKSFFSVTGTFARRGESLELSA